MPEQIRLKVGGVTQQQITVYEEFARCIPGFAPSQKRDLPPHQQQSQVAAAQAFFRAGVQVERTSVNFFACKAVTFIQSCTAEHAKWCTSPIPTASCMNLCYRLRTMIISSTFVYASVCMRVVCGKTYANVTYNIICTHDCTLHCRATVWRMTSVSCWNRRIRARYFLCARVCVCVVQTHLRQAVFFFSLFHLSMLFVNTTPLKLPTTVFSPVSTPIKPSIFSVDLLSFVVGAYSKMNYCMVSLFVLLFMSFHPFVSVSCLFVSF